MPSMAGAGEKKIKGTTGRFVSCAVWLWNHPHVRAAYEVEWSKTRKPGREEKTHFFYRCSYCGSRTFMPKWKEARGWTVVEAEAAGFQCLDLEDDRRAELLAELGLQMAQSSGPYIPKEPESHYVPLPLPPKPSKPRKRRR